MGLFNSIIKTALAPSVAIGNVISKGITATTGIKTGTTTTSQLASTTPGKILGGAIASTAVAAAVAAAPASVVAGAGNVAKTVAKALVPTTAKGVITTAIVAPVAVGVLSKNPSAPLQVTSSLVNVGQGIGTFSSNPTLENALNIAKENPIITALGGVAILGAGVKTIVPAIASYENTQAIKEQTGVLKAGGNVIPVIPQETQGEVIPLATDTTGIKTQETTSIKAKPSVKRGKAKTSTKGMIQSVRVNVINRNSANRQTKNYLNRVAMFN
jgi:hypothetical protein